MTSGQVEFQLRCQAVERKHRALARGFTVKIGNDGLITIAPKRDHSRAGLKMLCATVAGFFSFKATTIWMLPPETYLARLEGLRTGAFFERLAAWMMQPDAMTMLIVNSLNSVVNL